MKNALSKKFKQFENDYKNVFHISYFSNIVYYLMRVNIVISLNLFKVFLLYYF